MAAFQTHISVSEQFASDSFSSLCTAMMKWHDVISLFESSVPKGLASDQKGLCHHTSDAEEGLLVYGFLFSKERCIASSRGHCASPAVLVASPAGVVRMRAKALRIHAAALLEGRR